MNTTKLRNIGSMVMFAAWILGLAVMTIASAGHSALSFLLLMAGVVLSIVLDNRYNSRVVKGIESLQKEVNELNSSLTLSKSKTSELEGKYDKASSDLADYKAQAANLQAELDTLKKAVAEAENADAEETSAKATAKSSKKK